MLDAATSDDADDALGAAAKARLDKRRVAVGAQWRAGGQQAEHDAAAPLRVADRVSRSLLHHVGRALLVERRQLSVASAQVGCLAQVGDGVLSMVVHPSACLVIQAVQSPLHAIIPQSR